MPSLSAWRRVRVLLLLLGSGLALGPACGPSAGRALDRRLADLDARERGLIERKARFEERFRAFWRDLSIEQKAWLTIAAEERSEDASEGLLDVLRPEQVDELRSLAEEKWRIEGEGESVARELEAVAAEAEALELRRREEGGVIALLLRLGEEEAARRRTGAER